MELKNEPTSCFFFSNLSKRTQPQKRKERGRKHLFASCWTKRQIFVPNTSALASTSGIWRMSEPTTRGRCAQNYKAAAVWEFVMISYWAALGLVILRSIGSNSGIYFFHLSFAAPGIIFSFVFLFFFFFCVVAHSSVRLVLHGFWPETFAFLFYSTLCSFSSFARLCSAAALIASTVQKERLLRLYALCTYEAPPPSPVQELRPPGGLAWADGFNKFVVGYKYCW